MPAAESVNKMAYRIFTDATSDLTLEMLNGLPKVEIIPMQVRINDQDYTYGPYGNLPTPVFYDLQRQGHFAKTSQINPQTYHYYFNRALMQGMDVLYLGFSSGMSGCMQSANICAEELKEKYPERKIICIDTMCAAVGEGFLVLEAAKRQAEGMGIDDLAKWIADNRMNVCHWFTVDTFEHLKHGGRVSAASAAVGTMLGIKPMLHVDDVGKLAVIEKPRGNKKAMEALLKQMDAGWMPGFGQRVIIGHGDDWDKARLLEAEVSKKFPNAEIQLAYIGPIIGAHTGPGMLALIYWGNNR